MDLRHPRSGTPRESKASQAFSPAGGSVSPRAASRCVSAGLAALCFLTAVADGAPAAQAPEFPTEAELVTVDVVVLGRDGQPVRGLMREDFQVFEDGRPQAVRAFEAIEALVPTLVAPEATTARPSAARVATNVAGPPTRRTFAIVFDDMHVGDVNVELAKRAVETFVARDTVPGDRIVLVTVSDGRYWATNRGAEDGAWRDALKGVRSRRHLQGRAECRVTYYEAMQADLMGNKRVADLVQRRLDALCSIIPASPEELAWRAVRSELDGAGVVAQSQGRSAPSGPVSRLMPSMPEAYARHRGQLAGSLRVLREIVNRLGATPGRKSLVLVTEGFPVDPSLDVFREVREQAARANVAIHFLDARGLAVGPEFLSAAGSRGTIPGPDLGPTLALWKLEDGGAKALADETGGRVLQTNDLVSGLAQVAEESRVTYLLGYEPTNSRRDGRYRKLKVEVLRPGLSVRARAGYFALKGTRRKPAPEPSIVDRVLRNPFDADGIPLRLAAYVMGPAPLQSPVPKTGVEVLVAGEVRLDAIETEVRAGRRVAEPKLKLFVGSRARETHESEWTLEVALTPLVERVEPEQAWHPFLTRIAMGAGDHRARLVVESGGRVGSVTTDFVVPDWTEERLSTPILSDQLVAGAGARRVMPVVRRSFPASSTLHAWLELHGAAVESKTGQPRATASFVVRSAEGREWASGAPVPMSLESARPTRLVSLPLAAAPEGENELVLVVRDEVSGRTFEAREPFRVEAPSEAAPSAGSGGR